MSAYFTDADTLVNLKIREKKKAKEKASFLIGREYIGTPWNRSEPAPGATIEEGVQAAILRERPKGSGTEPDRKELKLFLSL